MIRRYFEQTSRNYPSKLMMYKVEEVIELRHIWIASFQGGFQFYTIQNFATSQLLEVHSYASNHLNVFFG